jgi:rubredoxin
MREKPELQKYAQRFALLRSGLPLGAGTEVEIASLKAVGLGRAASGAKEHRIRIEATLRVSAVVGVIKRKCSMCDAVTPSPDADALWFMLENHDGERLCFPRAEEEAHSEEERDMYPAQGWAEIDGDLVCEACAKATREALAALKHKRRTAVGCINPGCTRRATEPGSWCFEHAHMEAP